MLDFVDYLELAQASRRALQRKKHRGNDGSPGQLPRWTSSPAKERAAKSRATDFRLALGLESDDFRSVLSRLCSRKIDGESPQHAGQSEVVQCWMRAPNAALYTPVSRLQRLHPRGEMAEA